VRGLEQLEQRLTALERKVDKLGKPSPSSTPSPSSGAKTTSTKSPGAKKS
jgi:hypothetical protein